MPTARSFAASASRFSWSWRILGFLAVLAPDSVLLAQSNYATPYTFAKRPGYYLSGPFSVTVDGLGNSYVACSGGRTVEVFDSTGQHSSTIGVSGSPKGVAVGSNGNVYISIGDNNTVQMAVPTAANGGTEWTVSTIAGAANAYGDADGPGGTALFYRPAGIVVDSSGNVYVADMNNSSVRMIVPAVVAGATTWTVSTIAGLAGSYGTINGTGGVIRFGQPTGLALDASGNLYVADDAENTIRMITPSMQGGATMWTASTVAGEYTGGSADGVGTAAQFLVPTGVAVDSSGNLFVADMGNDTIRKIVPTTIGGVTTWAVTTIGGKPGYVGTTEGTGIGVLFNSPTGVAVDSAGNVYVTDSDYTLVWGALAEPAFIGVPAASGTFGQSFSYSSAFSGVLNDYEATGLPLGLSMDGATGVVSGTIQGDAGLYPVTLSATNGAGTASALLNLTVAAPVGAAAQPGSVSGISVTVGDGEATVSFNAPEYDGGNAITEYAVTATPTTGPSIMATGTASPVTMTGLTDGVTYSFSVTASNSAGTGASSMAPEAATPEAFATYSASTLSIVSGAGPNGMAVDAAGNIYATVGNAIEKYTLSGSMSVIAGSLSQSGSADGGAATALFNGPSGIAIDASGILYVADTGNNAIRKITAQGVVSTMAGLIQGDADGAGINAEFNSPKAVAVDGAGNVYVADSGNNLLREVAPDGTTSTLLSGAAFTFANQGQYASGYSIVGVAVDASGNPCIGVQVSIPYGIGYFASTEVVVLKVTAGNASTVLYQVGAGSYYFSQSSGDGALAVDRHGDIHVLSAGAIDDASGSVPIPQGTYYGYGGYYPFSAIAADSSGRFYAANPNSSAILVLSPVGTPPVLLSQPSNAEIAYGADTTLSVTASGSPTPSYQWQVNGTAIAGATSPSYITSTPGSYTVVITNLAGSVTSNPTVLTAATRLANISSRAYVGSGSEVEIAGFVVSGPPGTTEQVLIRGVGPALAQFSVTGFLARPVLTLYDANGNQVAANTGWNTAGNAAQVAAAIIATGAFQYALDSSDSALLVSLSPGAYTAQISGVGGSTGVALAEIYEITAGYPELINISTRAYVGTLSSVEIAGIVVSGSQSAKVLVRAVGPTLGQFGVSGALAQPSLSVMDSSGNVLATNTGWSTSADAASLKSEAQATGAFALPDGSADSAILITLPPGNYTATVSGVGGTTGVALVEVYQAP